MTTKPLTAKQEAFCQFIMAGKSQADAYRLAFDTTRMKADTIRKRASELMDHGVIKGTLAEWRAKRAEKAGHTAEEALEQVWAIAMADAREFVEYIVGCCRHCWGKDYRYQRTATEFERDEEELAKVNEAAIESGKTVKDFDPKGGIGYDKRLDPNPECPECFGEGEGRTMIRDTRKISAGTAALFAGIKETKEGVEIKFHSKGDALDKVFRHLGLYEKDNKQRSPLDGVPRETLKAIAERLRGGD